MPQTLAVPPRRRACAAAWILMASLSLTGAAQAQSAGFTIIGHIEAFTLAPPSDPFSAATMTVRNLAILLPRNLMITMPGSYATPQALFRGQPRSGLALADPAANPALPRIPFEAEVIGNITGGRYVAGVVRISQGALHIGAGFIQAIDEARSELRIGDQGGTTGARVRLNDPKGIYGLSNGAPARAAVPLDDRFALDPDNSPVHARTGFPVCIPRAATDANASKCPADNRPLDTALRRFTCSRRNAGQLGAPAETNMAVVECDPSRPVPLRVGDFVSYVGMLVADPAGGFLVAAHGLEAELGVYTVPGTEPVYLFVEEAIQGTKGETFPGIPQEETTRFRIVGFTTDPSRNVVVQVFDGTAAADATPFTGPAGLPPSNGPQLGRFRNTWPAKDDARAVRRDVRVSVLGSANATQPSTGLTSGRYEAPVSEYIYPEATRFGVPGFPLPVPFESFCFLARGGMAVAGLTPGRLDPFPESGHPQSQRIGNGERRVCEP